MQNYMQYALINSFNIFNHSLYDISSKLFNTITMEGKVGIIVKVHCNVVYGFHRVHSVVYCTFQQMCNRKSRS